MTMSDVWVGSRVVHRWWHHLGLFVIAVGYVALCATGRLTRWCLREGWYRPNVATGVVLAGIAGYMISPFAAPATYAALSVGWLCWRVRVFGRLPGASGAPPLGPTLLGLSSITWRTWRLQRRWGVAAGDIMGLVDVRTGMPPRLRRWDRQTRVRASCVVNASGVRELIADLNGPKSEKLAQALRLRSVIIEPVAKRYGLSRWTFLWGSPLDETQPLSVLPAPVSGWAFVGVDHKEQPAGFKTEFHTLFVGESRSGKSTTMWAAACSILESGDPTEFWIIDQSQTEFAAMLPSTIDDRDEFAGALDGYRYARTQLQGCELLRLIEAESRRRAEMLRGTGRKLDPTPECPRIILVIDEFLQLIRRVGGPQPRGRVDPGVEAERALVYVLSQCAKYGIVVWAGTQAGKISMVSDVRDLFMQRVALSTSSQFMTDAALGDQATSLGAICHKLNVETDAGRGFMKNDGLDGFREFRTVWVPDEACRAIGLGEIPDELLTRRGRPSKDEREPGAVYIMWGEPDTDGKMACLYIGKTKEAEPGDRWRDHLPNEAGQALASTKPWGHLVWEVEVIDCVSHAAAKILERKLIEELHPQHNVQHNGSRPAGRSLVKVG